MNWARIVDNGGGGDWVRVVRKVCVVCLRVLLSGGILAVIVEWCLLSCRRYWYK